MRVVLHAGLHKSATTFVQSYWGSAFGSVEPPSRGVWYPLRHADRPLGHPHLTFPLLRAFTGPDDPDLARAHAAGPGAGPSLRETVDAASAAGVEHLVISSEDLDRVVADDAPGIAAAVAGHDVVLLVTATRPAHRWAAAWQTLVRHGLAGYPREAARHVERLGALTPGRLEEVLRLLPASERVLRTVRTSPDDPLLARDLAASVGLPDPGPRTDLLGRNRSLGPDIEVLMRINRAGSVVGAAAAMDLLADLRGSGFTYREVDLADALAPTDACWAAARAEQAFLAAPDPALRLRVEDPLGLLPGWLDPEPPPWFAEIGRRQAVVPALADVVDTAEQLWRLRQERQVLEARLERAEKRVRQLRRQAGRPD